MERLTCDDPQDNFLTMMNYVFAKDGWAHIRHDGENEDVPLTEWAKAQCIKRGCDEFPGEKPGEIDEILCDCLMDGEGCPVALAYCFACQASHLRDRLKAIEDILGDDYDLNRLRKFVQAERDGRLVVLPCKVTDTVYIVESIMKGKKHIGEKVVSAQIDHVTIGESKKPVLDVCSETGNWYIALEDGEFWITRREAEAAMREAEHG